jgi:dihydrofolate reductase
MGALLEAYMREVHLKMSVSLDGFVAGPKGESEWIFKTNDDQADAWTLACLSDIDMHIMGSKTFHDMMSWWPFVDDKFAAPMNDIPKAVFTQHGAASVDKTPSKETFDKSAKSLENRPQRQEPDQKVLRGWEDAYVAAGPIKDEIARLKREGDKPIVAHGGGGFARSLIATGMVDEFQLLVHPVALGGGMPIFNKLEQPNYLKLIKAIPFPKGSVAMVYRPA